MEFYNFTKNSGKINCLSKVVKPLWEYRDKCNPYTQQKPLTFFFAYENVIHMAYFVEGNSLSLSPLSTCL